MTERDTAILPPNAYDAPWRTERLRARWPAVRVEHVEVEPCVAGRRVRAVVRLGDLTPADVRVGLTPATPAAPAATPAADAARAEAERMWSCESYDNGCFVFERVIHASESTGSGEWIVHVRPAVEPVGPAVLHPLHVGGATERG